MDINITLTLEDGELEAYQAEVAAYNTANSTSLTDAEYGALKLRSDALAGKIRAIDAKAAQIAAAAKSLPDDKRLSFTAQVEQLYATIAAS